MADQYTVNPYRYAVNVDGFSFHRVKCAAGGKIIRVEVKVYQMRGRSHWRAIWKADQEKPMTKLCQWIVDNARLA